MTARSPRDTMKSESLFAMYQRTRLDNGLRILSETLPHTRSVSVLFFLGAGSRYEEEQEAGISHFVEHMCFKGSQQRTTAREISEAIEGVGGILNASTDREMTVYWCKVARPHLALALDILGDMIRHPLFLPQEVDKERQVILEELSLANDNPQDRVILLVEQLLWPEQSLGWDVAGTRESVQAINREMLLAYLEQQYTAENNVISVVGDVSHEEVLELVSRTLVDWPRAVARPWFPAIDGQRESRVAVGYRKTDQAHALLAFKGLPAEHPDRYALDMLSVVLGEGTSSRLFLEIREEQALAYDVHSYVVHYRDCGAFYIYTGVEPRKARWALAQVLKELHRIKKEGVSSKELAKAKELAKGRLLLRMEDTRSVASWLGAQELLRDSVRSVEEVVEEIDAVSPEDLQRVAQGHLVPEKLNLAVTGPFRSGRPFRDLLDF